MRGVAAVATVGALLASVPAVAAAPRTVRIVATRPLVVDVELRVSRNVLSLLQGIDTKADVVALWAEPVDDVTERGGGAIAIRRFAGGQTLPPGYTVDYGREIGNATAPGRYRLHIGAASPVTVRFDAKQVRVLGRPRPWRADLRVTWQVADQPAPGAVATTFETPVRVTERTAGISVVRAQAPEQPGVAPGHLAACVAQEIADCVAEAESPAGEGAATDWRFVSSNAATVERPFVPGALAPGEYLAGGYAAGYAEGASVLSLVVTFEIT